MGGKRKKIRHTLIEPLKDKQRTMKLNYLLANNYFMAGTIFALDLFLFFGVNYAVNVLRALPQQLRQQTDPDLGIRNIFPDALSGAGLIVLFLVILVFDAFLAYKMKVSFGEVDFNVGQKGTERFANEEEIKEQYLKIEKIETSYPGKPGILICRIGNDFYIDNTVVNNLVIGITRSGKGEMFVKSSLEIYTRAQHKPTLIINDPKLEHYKVFKRKLEQRGYIVRLLNCSNPLLSMGFNPIQLVIEFYRKKDYATAEMVANSFAFSYFNVDKATGEMRYFISAASDLCTAMILAAVTDAFRADELYNQERYERWKLRRKEEGPFVYSRKNERCINLYSMVVNFGQLVTQPVDESGRRTMLDVYFEKRPANDRAKLRYLSTEVAPGKTKSGVFSEMLRELSVFTLHGVAAMTAESTLDFRELGFGDRPYAVFLATPSYDKSLYKLPTTFIRQMYYALGKECDEHTGKCARQVKCILDEAGNMPPIEMIETIVTMGLGQNISFDFYLQNYEQLTAVYGEEVAETIKGNCGNHIFIQTKSRKTANDFSEMLGTKSVVDVQRGGSKLSMDKYFTESIQDRPLLNANELLGLKEGECVIHRTMKRRDRAGKKIRPRPIFNSIENGHYLEYAYEYFPEEYKHPNTINLLDVCDESRGQIIPEERIWDLDQTFRMLQSGQVEVVKLGSLNFGKLDQMLIKLLGRNYMVQYGITRQMSVAEFVDLIGGIEGLSDIEKQMITEIVKEEAA